MASMQNAYFPLNTPFKPPSSLVPWFTANFILLMSFTIVLILLPLMLYEEISRNAFFMALGIIGVAISVFFIRARLSYDSMRYELHEDEMRWKRGVIFRTTGIVPYNRITNIDIRQGPVMRPLHISTVSIQTAGYSGKGVPEISIVGIVHAEELRELIPTMVRICSGSDGTGTGKPVQSSPADLQAGS